MKTSTLVRSFVVAVLAFGCGAAGHQIPRDRVVSPGEALFNGYTRPEINCYRCHDGTGRGTSHGPALSERVPKRTDDELARTIRLGKGKMPAWGNKLSDAEVGELVSWLRGTFP